MATQITAASQTNLPFWGIDGCKAGWFCAGLARNDEYGFFVVRDIKEAHEEIVRRGGKITLIDIPIGLRDDKEERGCDKAARGFITSARSSSVFRAPCRQAIEAYRQGASKADKEKRGKLASVQITGGCLSQQTWGIVSKIVEVDAFMQAGNGGMWREVHPEVCFRALKGAALNPGSKKKTAAAMERCGILDNLRLLPCSVMDIVADIRNNGKYPKTKLADDDIVDALAAAVTAKLGDAHGYKTLPECKRNEKPDSKGLPMEMVYAIPPRR